MIPAPTVTRADVEEAARRLDGRVLRTPLLAGPSTSGKNGELWLKCENLQKVGAFKARGALHHLLRLDPQKRACGVATYSSGNHGAALAFAAAELKTRATVFVPEDIPSSKRAGIESFGGQVVVAGRTSADRKQACEAAAKAKGWAIVPPFDDPWLVAGQGTCGLEILEQLPDVRRVLVPVGGGGLLAGVAVAIKAVAPEVEIIGVEPSAAASMKAAFEHGRPVEIAVGETIADGLKPVQVGALNFALASKWVARVVTVDDGAIRRALKFLLEQAKLVVEPSGAAAVAAWLTQAVPSEGKTVAILSGGNVDLQRLISILG